MKKIVKLLSIAIIIVGAVVGILYLPDLFNSNVPAEPKFESTQANAWKERIKELCVEGKWTVDGYKEIVEGIRSDRKMSNGTLISGVEEDALVEYLYSYSCSFINESLGKFFKQSSYSSSSVKSYDNAIVFLEEEAKEKGVDSNLQAASKLFGSYNRIMGLLSFNTDAKYYANKETAEARFAEFKKPDAETLRSSVRNAYGFDSYFKHNSEIARRLNNLVADRARAEKEYYDNLCDKIINNHEDYLKFVKDCDQFGEFANGKNDAAVQRLEYRKVYYEND